MASSDDEGSSRSLGIHDDLEPQNTPGNSLSGVDGDKSQTAFLRGDSEMSPMGERDRLRRKVNGCVRFLMCCCFREQGGENVFSSDVEEGNGIKQKQYRLESSRKSNMADKPWWHKIACWHRHIQQQVGIGISPNQSLAMYLHWMFRVNFFFLFTLSCIVFFALTIFFAGLIIAAGRMDEECVRVGGQTFESAGTAFADAFALSWTTFSTVVRIIQYIVGYFFIYNKFITNSNSLELTYSRVMEVHIQRLVMKTTTPRIVYLLLQSVPSNPLLGSCTLDSVVPFYSEKSFVFNLMHRSFSVTLL